MLELIAWVAAGFSAVLFALAVYSTFIGLPGISLATEKLTPLEWFGVVMLCGFLGVLSLL